jgi:hypothetical protein
MEAVSTTPSTTHGVGDREDRTNLASGIDERSGLPPHSAFPAGRGGAGQVASFLVSR